MNWGAHLAEGLRPVVDLVYPPRCPLCGDAVAEQSGLCVECFGELEMPGEPACSSCSIPMGAGKDRGKGQCVACEDDPPRHAGVVAATIYNDASRKLILSFKHGGKIAHAKLLGRLMAARIKPRENAPLLIPVPLHRWRLWGRGYNQSALLARELERNGKGRLLVDGLVRTKQTPSLGGLGSEARRKVLRGAISVRRSRASAIKDQDIILVDDVLTSGATSNACVDALVCAGAASVRIACFARVVNGVGKQVATHEKQEPQNETPEVIKTPGAT